MSKDRGKERKVARGSPMYDRKISREKREVSRMERLSRRDKARSTKRIAKTGEITFSMIPDPENADRIIRYLADNGISIHEYKRNYIVRRIRARVVRSEVHTYKAYFNFLLKNHQEIDIIKKSLSINVTRFFRNRDTFDFVLKNVLSIVDRARVNNTIQMWSAGCAVGAEPYSMAMMMDKMMTPYSIQATDIKSELLDLARGALYDKGYLSELNPVEIESYFDEIDETTVKVKEKYRSKVNFFKLNLLEDRFPMNFDIIFCRNVLIYIDKEPQIKIINGFMDALRPGGFLILGRTESVFRKRQVGNIEIFNGKHRVYRRKL